MTPPRPLVKLLRQFLLIIPLVWSLSGLFGLKGAWCAFPITDTVAFLLASLYFWVNGRRVIMKSYRKVLKFFFPTRRGLENITGKVQQAIDESGVREGLVLVNAMNITASVFINDDESGLHHDYETWLERLAPEKPYDQYRHNGYEDNADAHLKRTVMGREVVCAVTDGKLDFGTWEQIFYFEFDGKREKRVLIKIIGA